MDHVLCLARGRANTEFTAGTADVQISAVMLDSLCVCVCKKTPPNYSASRINWGDLVALGYFEVWSLTHMRWAATACPLCIKNRRGG